jgi:hypothetical protein
VLLISVSSLTFQIDSDLVFDDGAANNDYVSHSEHRKTSSNARHHSNISQHYQSTKSHHEAFTSDHHIVAPVESPLEDLEEAKVDSDPSFFGRLSELGKRAKRQWFFDLFGGGKDSEGTPSSTTEGKGLFGIDSKKLLGGWFGSSDEVISENDSSLSLSSTKSESESVEVLQLTTPPDKYRNKRSTSSDDVGEVNADGLEVTDEENTTDQLQGQEDDETDLEATAAGRRPGHLEHQNSDDEDYISEAASGSGMGDRTLPTTSPAPHADLQPREYCTRLCKV